jgi:GNAT superfamily N-acetyltransferase
MVQIKEAMDAKDLRAFVVFPFKLYKNCPWWVPPIIKEEIEYLSSHFENKNEFYAKYFLAYKNEKIVGRIAALINWNEVNQLGIKKIRFGWFDVEDDLEISKRLINKVAEFGRQFDLDFLEGPLDFSGMDRAGMLTFGFDKLATIVGLYNYPYYPEHLKIIGMKAGAKWQEYIFNVENAEAEKYYRLAEIVEKRFKVKCLKFRKTADLIPLADEIFDLLNKTYASLKSFVPIGPDQIQEYKKKFLPYIRPDFVTCIIDQNQKLIAFSITVPSLSKAFRKAGGKIYPFGFLYLWRALRKNDQVDFYLIGVDPEYQSKGITALIFREMHKAYTKAGIKTAETNPQLEDNFRIQALWKTFNPEIHKRRQTFIMKLKSE